MPTEIIDILIRTSGTAAARQGIYSIGNSASTAAGGVRLLTRALAVLGVTLGVRELIQTADAFTTLNNKLRISTKSAEEAATVQRALFEVANETRTPVEAAATLFQRLALSTKDLGATQADILQVTRTLSQAVQISGATSVEASAALIQLSQAFASGVLRGDEFRSVSEQLPFVLDIVADRTGKTRSEIINLGRDGKLSAKLLFESLLGAADEVDTKFAQVRPTIGSTFTVIRNEIIQTVGTLDTLLGASTATTAGILGIGQGLSDTLLTVIGDLVAGFAEAIRFGADVVDVLENIGLTSDRLALALKTVVFIIQALFEALRVGARFALTSLSALILGAVDLGNKLGLVSDEVANEAALDFLDQATKFGDALTSANENVTKSFGDLSAAYLDAAKTVTADTSISDSLRATADAAEGTAARIRDSVGRVVPGVNLAALPGGGGGGGNPDLIRSQEQEKSFKKLVDLATDLRQAELKRIDPLEEEVDKLNEQIAKVKELDVAKRDLALRDAVVADLERERNRATKTYLDGTKEQATLLGTIETRLKRLGALDRDRAKVLREELNKIIADGGGVEQTVEKLRDFLLGLDDDIRQITPPIGEAVGDAIADGARQGLRAALTGGSFDFIDFFANQLADITLNQMENVFESLSNTVEDLFSKAGTSLFGESGLGSGFGAALGLAGSLALNALQGSSSNVRNNLARSAVTSSQATRGVIAGPTSIPIFQVGDAIADAFQDTNGILESQLATLVRIEAALRANAAAAAPTASLETELGATSASLT